VNPQAPQVIQESVPSPALQLSTNAPEPIAVVRVLSPVGLQYVFLTICLFAGAVAMIAVLIALVNGKTDFAVLAFPAAVLLVTVPIFAGLFLHLKQLELDHPELRRDPSKRRSTHFTQIIAFIVLLLTLIGLIFDIFENLGGQGGLSVGKALLDALCIVLVSGGILAYYWHDEHKA
jgi:hypothetical protein